MVSYVSHNTLRSRMRRESSRILPPLGALLVGPWAFSERKPEMGAGPPGRILACAFAQRRRGQVHISAYAEEEGKDRAEQGSQDTAEEITLALLPQSPRIFFSLPISFFALGGTAAIHFSFFSGKVHAEEGGGRCGTYKRKTEGRNASCMTNKGTASSSIWLLTSTRHRQTQGRWRRQP